MIANDCCFSNYDPRTVIDKEIVADLGSRMDVDSRLRVSNLGDNPSNEWQAMLIQQVCGPVMRYRLAILFGRTNRASAIMR